MTAKRTARREGEPPPGWSRNVGKRPTDLDGKRALVMLRNGSVCGEEAVSATSPRGWDVKTTRWSLRDRPHDVEFFKLL